MFQWTKAHVDPDTLEDGFERMCAVGNGLADRHAVEARDRQEAVSEQLGETREAVLWLQRLEVVEQQMILIPDYQVKARKIAADMRHVRERVQKAKTRAEKLIGETLPSFPDAQDEA